MKKIMDFIRNILTNSPGTISFSRAGTVVIVLTVLGNMTYLVVKTGRFPDATQIIALCAFNTSLYLTGKKFSTDAAIADINKLKPILPDNNTTTANVIVQPNVPPPQGD